jgi:hypothetical protein
MFPRRKTQAREPHPDARVEAQLQHVLSLYRAASRTEDRLADITREQQKLEYAYRSSGGDRVYSAQSAQLRSERENLESFISRQHEEITKYLVSLGEDALYLGPVP